MKDQYYFPKYLGGNGDYMKVFDGHPYIIHKPYVKEYVLITCGYHLG